MDLFMTFSSMQHRILKLLGQNIFHFYNLYNILFTDPSQCRVSRCRFFSEGYGIKDLKDTPVNDVSESYLCIYGR